MSLEAPHEVVGGVKLCNVGHVDGKDGLVVDGDLSNTSGGVVRRGTHVGEERK